MNEKAREYYKHADFSPIWRIDPFFFRFTQIRLKCRDRWVKTSIPTGLGPESLRKKLYKYAPDRAYYMVGRFLNSSKVGPRELRRAGYKIAYNLFLKQDRFVFDLDDGGKTLDKLIRFLVIEGLEIKYILRTFRGFHVCIRWEPMLAPFESPIEKEYATKELNKVLIEKVREVGVDCDDTSDPRQLVRIPLSYCEEMDGPLPLIYPIEGLESLLGNDRVAFEPKVLRATSPLPNPSGVVERKGRFIHVITNNVMGRRNARVPFMFFRKKEEAKEFIEEESLPLYAFGFNGVWMLSPVIFHKKDLLRFYKNRGFRREFDELKRYKHNVMPLKALRNPLFNNMRVFHDTILSKGHMNILRKFGWDLPRGIEIGNGLVHVRLFVDDMFRSLVRGDRYG